MSNGILHFNASGVDVRLFTYFGKCYAVNGMLFLFF